MNLIFKFIAILLGSSGLFITAVGYAVTIEAIPNTTGNQWIDMLLICLGVFLIFLSYISWTNHE